MLSAPGQALWERIRGTQIEGLRKPAVQVKAISDQINVLWPPKFCTCRGQGAISKERLALGNGLTVLRSDISYALAMSHWQRPRGRRGRSNRCKRLQRGSQQRRGSDREPREGGYKGHMR